MRLSYLPFGTSNLTNSVVCVVMNEYTEFLVGKSTANDIRRGKWCFLGGGIKEGETIITAAERECNEESNIHCCGKELIQLGTMNGAVLSNVAFVLCRAQKQEPKSNHEFSDMKWVHRNELLKMNDFLYPNREVLERAFD